MLKNYFFYRTRICDITGGEGLAKTTQFLKAKIL
jgi:hypothetical protein